MSQEEIFTKVKDIIVEKLSVKDQPIELATKFQEDLNADSLDVVEMIMKMEEEFSLSIPDEDAEKMLTVGDAVSYIEAKL